MLIVLSGVTGFLIGVAFFWATGQGRRNVRQMQLDNDKLRHVISELSLYKYGPQK